MKNENKEEIRLILQALVKVGSIVKDIELNKIRITPEEIVVNDYLRFKNSGDYWECEYRVNSDWGCGGVWRKSLPYSPVHVIMNALEFLILEKEFDEAQSVALELIDDKIKIELGETKNGKTSENRR